MNEPGSQPVELDSESFADAVLFIVDCIPKGKVLSYGAVADRLGTKAARAVGRVLSQQGDAVAWHRVVHADGSVASSHGEIQLQLLKRDGVPMVRNYVDMNKALW